MLMSTDHMLSTVDNPYNPFSDFDNWYKYDVMHGYNCCAYLDRIAKTSEALPENLNQLEIERAIDEIVKININGLYCKVSENDDTMELSKIAKI